MSDFTCDPVTRAELDASPNKLSDVAVIQNALGLTGRRIICKRDANAAATDVWATGVVFRNVGSTGALKSVAGKITGLGRIKGTTVSLGADLSTGKSGVRITNAAGTRWIQGSLGPAGSNKDFITSTVFTANNGLSLLPNFAISGKRLKPSGTGPAAPALTASAPDTFEVWNWTNPAAPTLSGTVKLNNRIDDFVYEDAELAEENGDVAVYQSTQSAIHGNHEFGFTLLVSHKGNTEANVEPLYQVIGSVAHRGTWTTYPFRDTFDPDNHVTFPDPFKVVMKNAQGRVLHTFEMRDGLAINDPSISQSMTATKPMRPNFNCFMQLAWQNTRPRKSTKSTKYYPGMRDDYLRPSICKTHYSFQGVEPMMTGGYQNNNRNGIHHMYFVGQWPQPDVDVYPTIGDPYGPNMNTIWPPHTQNLDGWDYEPGSFSTHNWYTGPGGTRPDRSAIPSTLALWATTPNGYRIQDNVPLRDMVDGYLLGHFNHSNKFVTDPKTLKFVDNSRILKRDVSIAGLYYGDFPNTPDKQVFINGATREGEQAFHYDKTGRRTFNGWNRDPLHSYANAGWGALLLNSPLHGIAAKWDFTTQLMITDHPAGSNNKSAYLVRIQAWDWLHHVIQWKLASTHSLGISRAEVENRFVEILESLYREIYVPAFVDNDSDIYYEALRRFGTPVFDDGWIWKSPGGQLAFYMSGVLALMKQSGMWSALIARGGQAKAVLEMQLRNMDKWCFERLVYTKYSRSSFNTEASGKENEDGGYFAWPKGDPMPESWAAWSAKYEAPLSDYTHNTDGSPRYGSDRDVSDHQFQQYAFMRRDFFPEYAHPLMTQAIAKLEDYHSQIATKIAAQPNPEEKRKRDFTYAYPGLVVMKAPTELGPA